MKYFIATIDQYSSLQLIYFFLQMISTKYIRNVTHTIWLVFSRNTNTLYEQKMADITSKNCSIITIHYHKCHLSDISLFSCHWFLPPSVHHNLPLMVRLYRYQIWVSVFFLLFSLGHFQGAEKVPLIQCSRFLKLKRNINLIVMCSSSNLSDPLSGGRA